MSGWTPRPESCWRVMWQASSDSGRLLARTSSRMAACSCFGNGWSAFIPSTWDDSAYVQALRPRQTAYNQLSNNVGRQVAWSKFHLHFPSSPVLATCLPPPVNYPPPLTVNILTRNLRIRWSKPRSRRNYLFIRRIAQYCCYRTVTAIANNEP